MSAIINALNFKFLLFLFISHFLACLL